MRREALRGGLLGLCVGAVLVAPAGPAVSADGGHGFGRMGPSSARTTSVSPTAGPDFEMPFACGASWTGSTRSSHSPSSYTIDFNAPDDRGKPVLASAPGVVVKAVSLTYSYGKYVVVDHGRGYTSLYAHLDRLGTSVGTFLDQGDLVGYVGTTGGSTGPHLHFEQRKDGAYFAPYFHRTRFRMGATLASANCNDRPAIGDWDGNGIDDVGFRRVDRKGGAFHQWRTAGPTRVAWGAAGDLPAIGDYDGDRAAQVGVRRRGSASWALRSRTGAVATVTGVGAATDVPITGDWDGNGRVNLGFYRPPTRTFYLRADDHTLTAVRWGVVGQVPVTGDWDGDGRTDIGSFDSFTGTWRLRVPSGTSHRSESVKYGTFGDLPAVGDWDRDGVTDLGVWRPGSGRFWQRKVRSGGAFYNRTWIFGSPR